MYEKEDALREPTKWNEKTCGKKITITGDATKTCLVDKFDPLLSLDELDGTYDLGKHFMTLKNSFRWSHDCKASIDEEWDMTDNFQKRCGVLTLSWVVLMFSTLCALPYFIVFTFFPGWAYKLHFTGHGRLCFGKCMGC